MTAPSNYAWAQGQGAVPADCLNTFVQTTTSIAALRGFTALSSMVCIVQGATAPNDGGQGTYYYNSASTATDNGTTIIVPTGSTQGAWIQLSTASSFQGASTSTVVNLASTVTLPIVSLTLPPGTWDVEGTAGVQAAATTVVTYVLAGVSLSSSSFPSFPTANGWPLVALPFALPAGEGPVAPIGRVRYTFTQPTTVFLVVQAVFSVSTCTAAGCLTARSVA